MTAAEPLDEETTEPAGHTDWTDDEKSDEYRWLGGDDWDEAWEPAEWLDQDDDGSAEAGRYRRVRTIDVGEWL